MTGLRIGLVQLVEGEEVAGCWREAIIRLVFSERISKMDVSSW